MVENQALTIQMSNQAPVQSDLITFHSLDCVSKEGERYCISVVDECSISGEKVFICEKTTGQLRNMQSAQASQAEGMQLMMEDERVIDGLLIRQSAGERSKLLSR